MDIAEKLRLQRKPLVLAAKTVMEDAFKRESKPLLNKAQLSHLIGVCNEAACAEEIELYIRYQASREKSEGEGRKKSKGGVWDGWLAQNVIDAANKVLSTLSSDELKVAAWRLYAVYLTREFTYQKATHPDEQRKDGDESRAPQGDGSRNKGHTGTGGHYREKGGRR
ncbi:hypothetical protein [Polyangium sp. 15x6]|uniref:hypothetical protein n=1 Tax=Polyangium sp. 15x6 TaxID=3042687 RepID=UPI00249B86C2|nr:hypothetical protein [Polyangium sp. 15x6]MDI3290988.1 hypothetical protein [Polyangium sp. 15x6]